MAAVWALAVLLSAAIGLASEPAPPRRLGMAACHVDILIGGLNLGRISDAQAEALSTELAEAIAGAIGEGPEDIMTVKKVKGKVDLMRGTTIMKWLPQSWPARTNPSGDTALVVGVAKMPKSTMYIAESASNNPAFKQEVLSRVEKVLPNSDAITGETSVLATYVAPINKKSETAASFLGSSSGPAVRPPWETHRGQSGGGGSNLWIILLVLLILGCVIFAILGLMRTQRQTQRPGGFFGMLGREPPKETWRDKLHEMTSAFWKKPPGGYGITGH